VGKKLGQSILGGLMRLSVICGPLLCLASFECMHRSALPELQLLPRAGLFYAATIFGIWALWGLRIGPVRLFGWWFAIASLLNMVVGAWLLTADLTNGVIAALVFLGYSLWQFLVFRWQYNYPRT
jgi:hypothetical protein